MPGIRIEVKKEGEREREKERERERDEVCNVCNLVCAYKINSGRDRGG